MPNKKRFILDHQGAVYDQKLVQLSDGSYAPCYSVDGITELLKQDWTAISITGKVRDVTKDLVQNFSDGTAQTIYFDSNGDWAGRSIRA